MAMLAMAQGRRSLMVDCRVILAMGAHMMEKMAEFLLGRMSQMPEVLQEGFG